LVYPSIENFEKSKCQNELWVKGSGTEGKIKPRMTRMRELWNHRFLTVMILPIKRIKLNLFVYIPEIVHAIWVVAKTK